MIKQISPVDLAKQLAQNINSPLLLDVREPHEVQICQLVGSLHIPMSLIPLNMDKLPDTQDIVIYCHHGRRSYSVAEYLIEAGFDSEMIFNLDGGIDQWAIDIAPSMVRY